MSACVLTLGPSAFPQEDEVEGVLKVRGGLSYRCSCQWKDVMHEGSFRLVLHQDEKPLIDTATYTDSIASEFTGTILPEHYTLSLVSEIQRDSGCEIRQVMCGRPYQMQPLDHVFSSPFVVGYEMFSNS